MPQPRVPEEILLHSYKIYVQCRGSIRKAASELGVSRSTLSRRLASFAATTGIDVDATVLTGNIHSFENVEYKLPPKGRIKRYIVTTAQNNTYVHDEFWRNLQAYAAHVKAKIMVSQITYNKASYGKNSVKPGKGPSSQDFDDIWYDDCLQGYFFGDRISVAPTLTLCGEQNIIPTATRPLSGFQTYPGTNSSAIFPHTTIAMECVPVMQGTEVKINYTTGAVTARNYIAKKAGLKAEYHHAYGALIVEVDCKGDWWVRQLNAKDDGSFSDLDLHIQKGKVTAGNRIEAINWGDIHWEVIDPAVAAANWGKGGIIDSLKPKYQFLHDTIDFHARNHHQRQNPHANFKRWRDDRANVRAEFIRVRDFINDTCHRPFCETVVVDSNHDGALERWLREGEYRTDPENAVFFLECQAMKYLAIDQRIEKFHLIENVMKSLGVREGVRFLQEDESFVICGAPGIECGMHGHLGPNGSRGTAGALSRIGKKANTGHSHTACIMQGLYVAGTCSKLRLEYTKGPSSWTHSHIVTYPSGKRAIITLRNGKWRA
jgi:hypothetical protein